MHILWGILFSICRIIGISSNGSQTTRWIYLGLGRSILEYKDEAGNPYLAYGHDYHPDLPAVETSKQWLGRSYQSHPHLAKLKKVL